MIRMTENAYVIVFPSVFAKNKITKLISNIKKILKIQDQKFEDIWQDESVIIIKANDPVFASSAISMLFGIRLVAIAKCAKNEFSNVINEITKVGSNLFLRGEKFYVKVEGKGNGFLPKDAELSATSALIEKTVHMEIKPGTEDNYDKQVYTYLTKSNAYVCVFSDDGLGGIPNNYHDTTALCCVYDELSAVSCLETIKEGYKLSILVCYRTDSDLLNLVKMINQIIPRLLESKISIDFFQIPEEKILLDYKVLVSVISELLITESKIKKINHISLAISPLLFSVNFYDEIQKKISKNYKIPVFPLLGMSNDIFKSAKEIGLGKFLTDIEKFGDKKFGQKSITSSQSKKIVEYMTRTKKTVSILIGPKNIHDILDSLGIKH